MSCLSYIIQIRILRLYKLYASKDFTKTPYDNLRQGLIKLVIKNWSIVHHDNLRQRQNTEYQIDQAKLIRNFNDDLMKAIVNPLKNNAREFTTYIIWESTDEPNNVKKNRNYEHKKSKPFSRYRMNYQAMS